MKKGVFLLALLFAMPVISQENKNTIIVLGEIEKTVLEDSYTVLIALQQMLVYEGQVEVEAASLSFVRANAIKKLEDLDIDFNRFKRSSYYEFAASYAQNRESQYYYLKTSDKEEVRAVIKMKSLGMSVVNIEVEAKKLTSKQLVELSIKAIANAKLKAEGIAKKMNKTIGEVVSVSDQNSSLQYVQSYGGSAIQSHGVTVTFELK